jgi:hypothetical protein
MLGQLTDEERRHLRALLDSGSTIRALADRLGCSIYKADLYKKRVEEKIKRLADFGEDGQAATLILLRYVGQDGGLRH